jgi:prevent-host-death family protein
MRNTVSLRELRADLKRVLRRVEQGARITVVYRSRPVCQLVPLGTADAPSEDLEADPLYRAGAVGSSADGKTARDHDELLYPARRG